ncbi:FAD binding domain-containing protein [Streptomyces sp. NPDC003483]
MKPAAFDYVAPRTVTDAVDALANGGRNAQVLAGGQSLLLEMHLERIRPDTVVDINRIPELDTLRVANGELQVGALVRHQIFESAQAVPGPLGSLFALAVVNIAHPPIRSRGTMVGSFGWGHPASEWCAIAMALDADIHLRGPHGSRTVAARDYFHGPLETDRRPGELITSVSYPLLADHTGVGFIEHRRTHFCFAQVAVAAVLTVDDGVIREARIGLVNCADRPLRAHAAEQALTGVEIGTPTDGYQLPAGHPFARAGRIAAEQDATPIAEPYADLEYRRHAIAVVAARTLCQAANDHRSRIAGTEGDSR